MNPTLSKPLADLPDPLPVTPVRADRPFDVAVRPPGSKSLTNRALILAALARGRSTIRRPLLDADDAERMIAAIGQLGAGVERTAGGDLVITGVDGRWRVGPGGIELNLNNAGTATRFLAAAALLSPGPVTIDGNARMRERPIGELAEALIKLGARVEYLARPGFPPLRIHAPSGIGAPGGIGAGRGGDDAGVLRGLSAEFGVTQSGQFISAVLMLGPWLAGGITVRFTGPITSASYVEMTLGLLSRLGANVQTAHDLRVVRVGPPERIGPVSGSLLLKPSLQVQTKPAASAQPGPGATGLAGFEYDTEPDASSATYFWAAAALVPGAGCTLLGLGESSLQGDARFPRLLERMGVTLIRGAAGEPSIQTRGPARLMAIDADMVDMPDAAMTLAALACFAPGTTVLRGLRTLRVKETDRIEAIRKELMKLGVDVRCPAEAGGGDGTGGSGADSIAITPPAGGLDCSAGAPRVEFDTYDDHRMAMALALIGLRRANVFIRNPGCVAKTYPTFWNDLARLYTSEE